jgi:hypothetical protein
MILTHDHPALCSSGECHSLSRMSKAKTELMRIMQNDPHTTPLEWARVLTEAAQLCIRQELDHHWEQEDAT